MWLARLDASHMPRGGKPRPDKPQQDPDTEYGQAFIQRERDNADAALVEPGQPRRWLFEQEQAVLHKTQREPAAEKTVPEARPQKRSAHESIARADQLRDFYFFAAVLDVEPNRIANDYDNSDAEQ